jgi:hypothetical protein
LLNKKVFFLGFSILNIFSRGAKKRMDFHFLIAKRIIIKKNGEKFKVKDEQVQKETYNSAKDAASNSSPPGAINLGPGSSGRKAADTEYHETEGSHACADDRKDHLHSLKPTESQVEHLVHHQGAESRAPVHRTAEDANSEATHYRRYQRSVRNARYAVVAHIT